ncbi:hypothetical protein [Intestinimonas sp. HCP28S3_D6]|uniref:hypothetical protein n=1 Tax=Intestinimonas sp. HCP28S3_D6 TaxID=3438942 RepID=UPI003F8A0DBD
MAKAASAAEPSRMIRVEEVMDILQISKSAAYHTMQRINKELQDKGYITHSGRVPRSYLMERCGLQGGN